MNTNALRAEFLKFFAGKSHTVCESDLLAPKNDPTVLFTSAGMNQFKAQFMGKLTGFSRAASCQKCLRTADLENVGRTSSHHTFFEMLGNFSFGDYFKKEAITWAWEFLTKVLKLPLERLRVSVHEGDDEAFAIWRDKIKIPETKIVRLGDKENFWPSNAPQLGPDGPCGPCSEIYYDWGKDIGCGKTDCRPGCDCGRFVEIWNLVFTQYNRKDKGVLEPLPSKNIDTGMGLERMAGVMQQVRTNYEIDIFEPIIKAILENTPAKIEAKEKSSLYAIADHARAVTFAIGDGVLPANEERGYVVRKLIRRAVWHGKNIGIKKTFLYKLAAVVAQVMREPYPLLEKRRENISQIVLAEEKRFTQTLQEGEQLLEKIFTELKARQEKVVAGAVVFKLYDTYGFPADLTADLAAKQGFDVDQNGFNALLEEQSKRSKEGSKMAGDIFVSGPPKELGQLAAKVSFSGYARLEASTAVLFILQNNKIVNEMMAGDEGILVLEQTPFYAEGGGQVGDCGVLENSDFKAAVLDTKKIDGTIVQVVKVASGKVKTGDRVDARVDIIRRKHIERNHTATHLLHYALRKVLGEHVEQSGSYVSDDRLRFDFTHFQALSPRQINRIEELVNTGILRNDRIETPVMDIEQARGTGAMSLFDEKYGKNVRVVLIGDYSKEFCGGTHIAMTGEIGLFKIISEASIAGGIRRIEALTGAAAYARIKQDEELLQELSQLLATPQEKLGEQVSRIIARMKGLEKDLQEVKLKSLGAVAEQIAGNVKRIDGIDVIMEKIPSLDMDGLRRMQDILKAKVKSGIIILGSVYRQQPLFVCTVSNDLVEKGFHAGMIVKQLAALVGGSGGGRPDMAQAGGKNADKFDMALAAAESIIRTMRG